MLIKTEGIVIYKVKYSETSLIIHLLTRELGVKPFIVKGVRSKKSKISTALFDYMNILDVEAFQRNGSDLLIVREVGFSLKDNIDSVDIFKSSVLLFLAEFIHKTLTNPITDAVLYDFVEKSIRYFSSPNIYKPDFHLWFITHFAGYLGIQPLDNFDGLNPIFSIPNARFVYAGSGVDGAFTESSSKLLHHYLNQSLTDIDAKLGSLDLRNQYLDEMLFFYRYHLDHFSGLKSLEILKSIFH